MDVVELERNVGLGPALDAGLAACRHDVVARMDADDISLPHRFAVQMPIIEAGVDIVGSGLLEFGEDADDVVGRRTPPTDPDDIRDPRPLRRPLQPPDRGLPARVRAGRRRLHRLRADGGLPALGEDDPRGGAGGERRRAAGALPRRGGGLRAAAAGSPSCVPSSDCSGGCTQLGFTTTPQYLRNVVVRGGYRLVPESVRRVAYRRLVAPYGERESTTGSRPPQIR